MTRSPERLAIPSLTSVNPIAMENRGNSEAREGSSAGLINDLFDYDVGLDEIMRDVPPRSNDNAPKLSSAPDAPRLGLGLDEEVKVRNRQPVAKLDDSRLLSQAGIPKLRRTAKHKLKFKGKGHEFSDAARLLNFYQLWLDDLFPRAKFADGLAIIEKLGHSKRLQTMRREWVDDEKPKPPSDGDERETAIYEHLVSNENKTQPEGHQGNSHTAPDDVRIPLEHYNKRPQSPQEAAAQDQLFIPDDNDALHMTHHDAPDDNGDDDDELEALLGEQENSGFFNNALQGATQPKTSFENNRHGDEPSAMEG